MEIYKKHPKYKRYEMSNLGNIRNIKTGRVLKKKVNTRGYEQVNLTIEKNRQITEQVHRVVMSAWYGDIEEGLQVDHIDRDRLNNKILNLRIVSCSVNLMNRKAKEKNESFLMFLKNKGVFCVNGRYVDCVDEAIEVFKSSLH